MARLLDYGANSSFLYPMSQWLTTQSHYNSQQSAPVDGSLMVSENNAGQNIYSRVYSTTSIPLSDFSSIIEACQSRKAIGWGRVNHNFLVTYCTGPNLDWMGDDVWPWLENLITLAKVVRRAGLIGLCFDSEPYGTGVWDWGSNALSSQYSFEAYLEKVYDCARYVAKEWLRINPDMQYMNIKSYTDSFSPGLMGLLRAWLDGIFDEFGENQTVTQWGSSSLRGRNTTRKIILADARGNIETDPVLRQGYIDDLKGDASAVYRGGSEYFDTFAQFGKVLWIDFPGAEGGKIYPDFDNDTPANSYFDETEFAEYVQFCAEQMDYVIIFNQYYTFWANSDFGTGVLSTAYQNALRVVRQNLGMP